MDEDKQPKDAMDYLAMLVRTQGLLFSYVAREYPQMDTADFIHFYMESKTRRVIDENEVGSHTLELKDLLEYIDKNEVYEFKKGKAIEPEIAEWIGEFYAYYQLCVNVPSREMIKKIPVSYLVSIYPRFANFDLEFVMQHISKTVTHDKK